MTIRPLLVDLGVWAGLAVIFTAVLMAVGYANRPPTAADLMASAEQGVLESCRGWTGTRALHAGMQEDVCQCVASRARTKIYGGVDDGDFSICRQRVAGQMSQHPDLDRAFLANFPQLCGNLEGLMSGRPSDGSSAFCDCLAGQVQQSATIKASYAFGDGEPASSGRDERFRVCSQVLAYGKGWQVDDVGTASMEMPSFFPYREAALRCAEDGARFEVLSGGTTFRGPLEFQDDVETVFVSDSGEAVVAAPDSYALIDKLAARASIGMLAGNTNHEISLHGFAEAAAAVLRQCAEGQAEAPAVVTTAHAYDDPWVNFEPGYTVAQGSAERNWLGTLVCEGTGAYLTLQGELVESVIQRNPDPAGTFLAADVPVTLAGDQGTLFDDRVRCDWGANEGDTDSCFVLLDRDRLDRLYGSGFVAITLDGEALDPVAFGTSAALQASRQACYRTAS